MVKQSRRGRKHTWRIASIERKHYQLLTEARAKNELEKYTREDGLVFRERKCDILRRSIVKILLEDWYFKRLNRESNSTLRCFLKLMKRLLESNAEWLPEHLTANPWIDASSITNVCLDGSETGLSCIASFLRCLLNAKDWPYKYEDNIPLFPTDGCYSYTILDNLLHQLLTYGRDPYAIADLLTDYRVRDYYNTYNESRYSSHISSHLDYCRATLSSDTERDILDNDLLFLMLDQHMYTLASHIPMARWNAKCNWLRLSQLKPSENAPEDQLQWAMVRKCTSLRAPDERLLDLLFPKYAKFIPIEKMIRTYLDPNTELRFDELRSYYEDDYEDEYHQYWLKCFFIERMLDCGFDPRRNPYCQDVMRQEWKEISFSHHRTMIWRLQAAARRCCRRDFFLFACATWRILGGKGLLPLLYTAFAGSVDEGSVDE